MRNQKPEIHLPVAVNEGEGKSLLSPTSSENAAGSATRDVFEGMGSYGGESEGGSGEGVTRDCSEDVKQGSGGIRGGGDVVICEGKQSASDCGGGESRDSVMCEGGRGECVGGESDSGPEDISLTQGREEAMRERRETARELKR